MKITNEMQEAFIDEMQKISAVKAMHSHYEVTLDENGRAEGLSDTINMLAGKPGGEKTVRVKADADLEKTSAMKFNVGNAIKSSANFLGKTMQKGWQTLGQSPTTQEVSPWVKQHMPVGWFGAGRNITAPEEGAGLIGRGLNHLGNAASHVTSLGGATRYLPVGAKTMTIVPGGLALLQARKKEDPKGLGRSRAERATRALVSTAVGVGAGGLGTGMTGMLGGMAAGMGTEHLFNKYEQRVARKKGILAVGPNGEETPVSGGSHPRALTPLHAAQPAPVAANGVERA